MLPLKLRSIMTQSTSLLGITYAIHINVFRLTTSAPSHSHISIGLPNLFAYGVSHLHEAYIDAYFTKFDVHRFSNVATSSLYSRSASGLLRTVRKITVRLVFSCMCHI